MLTHGVGLGALIGGLTLTVASGYVDLSGHGVGLGALTGGLTLMLTVIG